MAGLEVNIIVQAGEIDVMADLVKNARLKVKHSPGCCAPCRANDDPSQVPFPGCRSNVRPTRARSSKRRRRDDRRMISGNRCRCTVEVEIAD